MKNTLKAAFFCLSTLLTAPALASNQYGPYEYILPVNEPQIIANISMWTVRADCIIISEEEEEAVINIINVKALYKKGAVNDIKLTRGDKMLVTVEPGEIMRLTAESGARVELTNQGEKDITARCYANFDARLPHSPMPENIPNV